MALALALAPASAGKTNAARIATMAITTSNSIRVKPLRALRPSRPAGFAAASWSRLGLAQCRLPGMRVATVRERSGERIGPVLLIVLPNGNTLFICHNGRNVSKEDGKALWD